MKIKLLRIAVTVCISSFVLSACEKKHGIVILPVNNDEQKKFESHWKDVHDALNRKPEWAELYHIQDFSHGNLVGSAGKLPEILYVGEIKEAQFAVAPDFSGHAFQIGVGISKVGEGVRYLNKTDPGPDATPPQTKWPHLHLAKAIDESADLVKAVEEALANPSPTSTPEP